MGICIFGNAYRVALLNRSPKRLGERVLMLARASRAAPRSRTHSIHFFASARKKEKQFWAQLEATPILSVSAYSPTLPQFVFSKPAIRTRLCSSGLGKSKDVRLAPGKFGYR
jgi:hypothetical protein